MRSGRSPRCRSWASVSWAARRSNRTARMFLMASVSIFGFAAARFARGSCPGVVLACCASPRCLLVALAAAGQRCSQGPGGGSRARGDGTRRHDGRVAGARERRARRGAEDPGLWRCGRLARSFAHARSRLCRGFGRARGLVGAFARVIHSQRRVGALPGESRRSQEEHIAAGFACVEERGFIGRAAGREHRYTPIRALPIGRGWRSSSRRSQGAHTRTRPTSRSDPRAPAARCC